MQIKETTTKLQLQLDEEKSRTLASIQAKDIVVDHLQSQLKDSKEVLEKIEANFKEAKETSEKQVQEINDLKLKIKNKETQMSSKTHDLSEAKNAIEILKAELESTKKELSDKNKEESTPANNASLNALKSLFEEKEAECDKTKMELEVEKKRNSELVVTIKVLREMSGMPSTPSPSPSPSPSLSIPLNPPPLQLAHTVVRSQNNQSQITSSVSSSLSSSTSGHKRSSPTPPPLTIAPKIQRVIHVSENSSLESIAKDNSPSISSSQKKDDENHPIPDNSVASSKNIPKGTVVQNQTSTNRSTESPANSSRNREEAPTSTVVLQPPRQSKAPSTPTSSGLNNEPKVNGLQPSSGDMANPSVPALPVSEGNKTIYLLMANICYYLQNYFKNNKLL